MASYQDLETRINVIEDKLDFMMKAVTLRAAVTTGVLDSNGAPQVREMITNLHEAYNLTKQRPELNANGIV